MEHNNTDCRRFREVLGAHVLGGLESAERKELLAHLETCPECRREEAELRRTVTALGDPATFPLDASPSPNLEDRVVASVMGNPPQEIQRSRLKTYALPAAAALAVILIGTLAIYPSFFGTSSEPGLGDVETIAFSDEPRGVQSEGAVIAHTWGTEVTMEVSGLEAGEVYTVAVEQRDGSSIESGTFIGVGENEMDCELNAAVPRQDATAVLVTDSEGREVLRSELERRSADLYT